MTGWDLSRTSWRKSSRSGSNGGSCVEVAITSDRAVAVRDSKHPDGPVLVYSRAAWADFLHEVRAGSLDLG
jgi:hypothetical protein